MTRPALVGMIAILLLLPGSLGAPPGASSSIAPGAASRSHAPESRGHAVNLRLRLGVLDSRWNCRVVADRTDRHDSPGRIVDRNGEPTGTSRVIQDELRMVRLRFPAVRIVERYVVRPIIRWISPPDVQHKPERRG